MTKKLSDSLEILLFNLSKLAHIVNLLVVSFILISIFFIDNEISKSFLISMMSITVTLLYYIKINFEIFEKKILIVNDLICMIFWLVISSFWFSQFFTRI